MLAYLSLLSLILLVIIIFKYLKISSSITLFYILLPVSFFSGLRLPGTSSDDYEYAINFVQQNQRFEFLFDWLEIIVYHFVSDEVYVLFLISSLLSFFFLKKALSFHPKLCLVATLVYLSHVFLYRDMIQIRSAIAYNLILLFFCYYTDKKYFRCFLTYVSAIGFHFSSVASALVLLIANLKLKFKLVVCSFFFAFAFSVYLHEALSLLDNISILPDIILRPLQTYLLASNDFNVEIGLLNPTTLKTVILFFLFLYYQEKIAIVLKGRVFLNSYFIACLFFIAFSSHSVFASRFAALFSVSEIFLVPAVLFVSKNRLYLSLALFFVYFFMLCLNLFYKGMLDSYKFILQ